MTNQTYMKTTNLSKYKFGDILLVKFPFTDFSQFKNRPAIVLKHNKKDITVCFISSQIQYQKHHDYLIKKNASNQLAKNSIIKTWKISTIHELFAYKNIGNITPTNKEGFKKHLIKVIKNI